MFRSHTCGELRISDVNKQVTLAGWVQRSRKMGGMTFIDLRDRYGITQLVFNEEVDAALCENANRLGREFVIQITGTVNERFSKNANIPTGDIEIIVSELNVLNAALTPPFTIEDNTDGGDDIRMKYRYLDLRRPSVRRNLFKLFQNDIGLLAAQYAEGIQLRIIRGEKNINFGSVYENAVAQELVAHGIDPYYYNNKKRGELDFVIELDSKVLPIEVKSGKDYEVHRALSNIMDCKEYDLFEAVVFCNDNLRVEGKLVYAPVYMVMFLEKNNVAPTYYKVDLSMLQ